MARLSGAGFAAWRGAIAVLPVTLRLDTPEALDALIAGAEARCAERRGKGS